MLTTVKPSGSPSTIPPDSAIAGTEIIQAD